MKTIIFLFTISSPIATNVTFAQNAIGISYSTRIFPFQHYKNTNNDYVLGGDVEVSDAVENVIQLNYQFHPGKGGNRVVQIGLNYYFADLRFQQQFSRRSETWYSADPSAYPKTTSNYTQSGNYKYVFFGPRFSLLKTRDLSNHFFLKTGFSMSLNFLAFENGYNEEETIVTTTVNPSQQGLDTTTTYTKTRSVPDPEMPLLNYKIEFPVYLQYNFNKSALSLGFSAGISTQSRVIVNDVGLNLFISPTVSYTWFLQKKP